MLRSHCLAKLRFCSESQFSQASFLFLKTNPAITLHPTAMRRSFDPAPPSTFQGFDGKIKLYKFYSTSREVGLSTRQKIYLFQSCSGCNRLTWTIAEQKLPFSSSKGCSIKVTAMTFQGHTQVLTSGIDGNNGNLKVMDADPDFSVCEDHPQYRHQENLRGKHAIQHHEEGFENFSLGYNMAFDTAVTSQQLTSERVEAKALVVQFLKRVGLSTVVASRIVNKAGLFITHLMSILHSRYHSRYLSGSELSTIEIRSSLLPHLEGLAAKHGDNLANVLLHFPNPPPIRKCYGTPTLLEGISSQKRGTVETHAISVDGKSNPSISYMLAIGLTFEQVQLLVRKFPHIATYNPERKIKPVVDLLLALGVSQSGLCKVFLKRPQIFGCSLEENLRPTLVYLESLGVERNCWARILVQFPALLTYSKEKIELVVGFLKEMGLSSMDISKVLNRFPHVVGFSVEQKMKPTIEYLKSIGIKNAGAFLLSSPQVLGYSIEGNIKPTCSFFTELGFTNQEIMIMMNRYPQLLGLAINGNLRPKWDFFVQIGWPKSQLVTFPQYFGYSLHKRIKPRFEIVKCNGLFWNVNRILSASESEFQRLLDRDKGLQEIQPNANHISNY